MLTAGDWGPHALCGHEVTVTRGGQHGPDFFGLSLQSRDRFRLDVFNGAVNPFACRLYIFAGMLLARSADESLMWLRSYAEKLGLHWDADQLSRLDLCADVDCDFQAFKRRIERGLCVTGRMRCKKKEEYRTTVYFGSRRHVYMRIYDKSAEQGENDRTRTRVEFEMHRNWLRRQRVDSWADAELPVLWRNLTQRFRILERRPDGKHHRPTWPVWRMVQEAADIPPCGCVQVCT
jgi:hypothetical protein